MTLRNGLYVILFLFFQFTAFTQKIEKESRVSVELIPAKAVKFISDLDLNDKVKWYKEKTTGRDSYESKFKLRGFYYSVEFDTLGNIEDVEILQKKRNLSLEEREVLKAGILKEFEKFKWVKIQRQYIGKEHELKKIITQNEELVPPNFEVEVEVLTSDGSWEMYEILLDNKGEVLMKREVQLRPTDNLNY